MLVAICNLFLSLCQSHFTFMSLSFFLSRVAHFYPSLSLFWSTCMFTSPLDSAHQTSARVTGTSTHALWLKLCHTLFLLLIAQLTVRNPWIHLDVRIHLIRLILLVSAIVLLSADETDTNFVVN